MSLAAAGVGERRAAFLREFGFEPEALRSVRQEHSKVVLFAGGSEDPSPGVIIGADAVASPSVRDLASGAAGPEAAGVGGQASVFADGLATADAGLALSVTVADCMPVLLFDSRTKAIALLHSGWKGTGIVSRALELMAECWGTRPADVAAALGPCIGPCCYDVDEERAAVFEARFGADAAAAGGAAVRRSGGRAHLDLRWANIGILARAGVPDATLCDACTYEDIRLGSFRREGAASYTRMLAVAGLLREE